MVINSEQEQVPCSKSVFLCVIVDVDREVTVALSVILISTEGLISSEWGSSCLVLDWSEKHGWDFQMGRWITANRLVRP